MRKWLPIALLTAPPLFAADLPPAFKITPGHEEVPSYRACVQFDTRTPEDLATGWEASWEEARRPRMVMNIQPAGSHEAGEAQMADHEASLKSDGWTIIRDKGELEAKKRAGATTVWYQSFPNSSTVTILEEVPPPRVLTPAPNASPYPMASD